MMDEIFYSISEVSERIGLTYRALHYYQQKVGLQINRDGAGNRIYRESDIEILEKIIELKKKGMSLDGIKQLFEEKGLVVKEEGNETSIVVVDEERSLELKEFILTELKEVFTQELKSTNNKLDQIIQDNKELCQTNTELHEELRKLQRQSEEHYNKIDKQITEWRIKMPWYKRLFKK